MKIQIKVTGRVQGVGFRYTTFQIAQQLGVKGTVKNQDDGSVVIQAEGSPELLTKFIAAVKKPANPFAKVKHLEQFEDSTLPDFSDFNVIY